MPPSELDLLRLDVLSARALNAAVNDEGCKECLRDQLQDQLCKATGLSRGMLSLLRTRGLMP